jgi:2-hydroxycyclohexanecarboxyl-CoA dehydrogenase
VKLDLQGQTVVVVGGANGIGLAIAREFYREGCHVALVDLDPNAPQAATTLTEVWSDSKGPAPHCGAWLTDITDESSTTDTFNAIIEAWGDIRHVVIAAGIGSGKFGFPFWNMSPSDWKKVMDVNVMGVVHVAHACYETLKKKAEGSITLLASVAGQIGSQTDPPYSAAKAAVINFGQCMAKDLAPYGIRVNTICPGMVQTQLNRSVWKAWNDQQPETEKRTYEDWAGEKVSNVVPLRRWQTPEDIAGLAVYLASSRGRNITGQTMNVDGGFVMHW